MKYNYFSCEKLFLLCMLVLFIQTGIAQNLPFAKNIETFAEIQIKNNDDGTSTLNKVTFGPQITKVIKESEDYSEEVTVVFSFEDPEIAKLGRPLLAQMGGQFTGPVFEYLPVQGITASLEEIFAMTKVKGLKGIWNNRQMDQTMHQAIIVSSVKDAREDLDFAALNGGVPLLGRGVGVLVNDSGFDGEDSDLQTTQEGERHPRIEEQVRGNGRGSSFNWIESAEADTDQGNGHGSHCMGIVGGDGRHSDGKITGVAPASTLVGYGSGVVIFVLDGLGGFEYALKHRKDYNFRVISNSFGSGSDTMFTEFSSHVGEPYNVASKALTDNGVIVVFAAGNGGPTDGKIGGNFITAPWVISVANGTKSGDLAGSSSPGRKDPNRVHPSQREEVNIGGVDYLWENRPTVTAPGTDIIAVRATGSALAPLSALDDVNLQPTELPYYTYLTGTSMACPHIAGIIALMIEANHNIEWRAAKAVLQRTAIDDMNEAFYQRGAGYVNAHAAVAAAFHGLCDVPANASYEEKYGLPTDGSFGFDDDPWKTCPLHPEVASRIKTTIPSLLLEETACGPTQPPLTDETGINEAQPTSPFFDLEEVTFHDETATDFKITLKVAGNLIASPPGGLTSNTSQHFYDVHFNLNKPANSGAADPEVTYIVTSYDELATKNFFLTVKTADGTTRPSTGSRVSIAGQWDTGANTITWTVPKAELNVSAIPAAAADAAPKNGRAARAGDTLKRWAAYCYERAALITPDGAGVFNDTAEGDCFLSLEQ